MKRIILLLFLVILNVCLWPRFSKNRVAEAQVVNSVVETSVVEIVAPKKIDELAEVTAKTTDREPLVQFLDWAKTYSATSPAKRRILVNEGVRFAKERRALVKALIQSNPEEALRQAVPMSIRQELPPEILAQLEERVSSSGELAVLALRRATNVESDVAPIQRFARLDGKTYNAYVYGRRVTQATQSEIPLYGIAIDDQLAVHEDPVRPLEEGEIPDATLPVANADQICGVSKLPSNQAAAAQVGKQIVYFCAAGHIGVYNQQLIQKESVSKAAALSAWTSGIKTMLFMRVNFTDDTVASLTAAQATTMMNSVSNWLAEMSYNVTGMRTTFTPLLTMPHTKYWYQTNYNSFTFMDDARAVAKANGYDTVNYDRDLIDFKPIYAEWTALGYVGGKGIWIQTSNQVETVVHECGHNYGLWHANAWNADNDTIIGPGTHQEQGNPFDTMATSIGVQFHFNACAKNGLGWLPDANVTTVTNSGEYRVHAYDAATTLGNLFYALKINKDERDYWVEFRSRISTNQWLQNGVLLSWAPWSQSDGGSHLLDVTPGSPAGKLDSALVIGRTFSDPFAGIHLTPIRKNSTTPPSIDVVANLGTFPNNHAPTLSINASSTTVAANVAITFTATGSDADGDALIYFWDFDDPNGALSFTNGASVAKSWSASGDFRVRCIVSDMKGGTASAAVLVKVGSPTLYRISGRVLNGAMPVEGARIAGGPKSAFTDTNGDYVLTGIASGNYTLSAVKPGWNFSPSGFANPFAASGNVSNINFNASLVTYSVNGRVTDYLTGISGVTVNAGSNTFVTASDGNFTFNLPAGAYTLSVAKVSYELTNAPGWTNPVMLDWVSASGKNFQRSRYAISGVVSNLPSAPTVSIGDANEQLAIATSGVNQWTYTLQLPRGSWNLSAVRAGYTILPANFANAVAVSNSSSGSFSYNFNATLGASYSISGNLAESDRPISGALVNAGTRSGYSDSLGNYLVPGLTNGTYAVSATSPNFTFVPATRTAAINNANVAGQDFLGRLLFWLTQPVMTTNGFSFQLAGGTNRSFRVEASTNFMTWQSLVTVTNTAGQSSLMDLSSTNNARFYRAVLLP
jgi:hypothetical protein